MTKRRSSLGIASFAVLVLCLRPPTLAPAASPGPEDVAAVALKSLKEDRTEDFVKVMHPEALTQLRTALLQIHDEAAKAGKAEEVLSLFDGVKDANHLKSLNGVSFMVAYLRGSTKRIPGFKATLAKMDMRIVGHVSEGTDKAHVVYRMTYPEEAGGVSAMKVIGLRKNGPGWGMLLGDDIEVLLLMLKQKIEGNDAPPKFDMAASQVQFLGQILESGEKVHEVFRLTTPINQSKVSKVSVLSVSNTDPEWAIVKSGKKDEIVHLIEQSMGIKPKSQPAANKAAPR